MHFKRNFDDARVILDIQDLTVSLRARPAPTGCKSGLVKIRNGETACLGESGSGKRSPLALWACA